MEKTNTHSIEDRSYRLFKSYVEALFIIVLLRYLNNNTSGKLHEIQSSVIDFFLIVVKLLTHPWVYNFICFSLLLSLPIFLAILISKKRKQLIKKVTLLLVLTVVIRLIDEYFSMAITYHF